MNSIYLQVIAFCGFLLGVYSELCDPVQNATRQSPITINPKNSKNVVAHPLKWSLGFQLSPQKAWLVNDGHTLKLTVNQPLPLTLSGGLLKASYHFQQLHFHWRAEHVIQGNRHETLEMHVVFSQTTNNQTDENVVVGFLFDFDRRNNTGLQNILAVSQTAAQNRNVLIPVKPFPLSHLIDTKFKFYYTYEGSLTTPPYSENVKWIIPKSTLRLSNYQESLFYNTSKADEGLRENYRCLQDLNGRVVNYVHGFI